MLLNSVRVRDALLSPDPSSVDAYRDQVQAIQLVVLKALDDYQPVLGLATEREQVNKMRQEVEQFHLASLAVLADARGQSGAAVRDLLNRHLGPKREAAVQISEDIQALNRLAYIRQQADIVAIHREAERQSWRRLGFALVVSLAVLLLAGSYSARLESRLRRQMERDARLTGELHAATVKLIGAQEDERRTIARELHDEVGQVLTAIKVEFSIAQRDLEASGMSAESLVEAQVIADGGLRTVRDITQLLHPAALDDLGLAAAIDASLRGLARRHDIQVEFSSVDMAERLKPLTEVAAYRIVQANDGFPRTARPHEIGYRWRCRHSGCRDAAERAHDSNLYGTSHSTDQSPLGERAIMECNNQPRTGPSEPPRQRQDPDREAPIRKREVRVLKYVDCRKLAPGGAVVGPVVVGPGEAHSGTRSDRDNAALAFERAGEHACIVSYSIRWVLLPTDNDADG